MIYDISQSARQPSDNHWRRILRTIIGDASFFLPISTFSALGVFHVMRYIGLNARYLLTYLLLPRARIVGMGWVRPTNFKRNDHPSSENKTMLAVDPSTTASPHYIV